MPGSDWEKQLALAGTGTHGVSPTVESRLVRGDMCPEFSAYGPSNSSSLRFSGRPFRATGATAGSMSVLNGSHLVEHTHILSLQIKPGNILS